MATALRLVKRGWHWTGGADAFPGSLALLHQSQALRKGVGIFPDPQIIPQKFTLRNINKSVNYTSHISQKALSFD